jgi:AraC-like DNA-binding protein
MHPRAVQRTLEAEGTSFRLLLRDARLELAEYLLRLPRIRISEISSMLGYSNVSAFTRAFEQTKGMPPSRLRSFAGETAV